MPLNIYWSRISGFHSIYSNPIIMLANINCIDNSEPFFLFGVGMATLECWKGITGDRPGSRWSVSNRRSTEVHSHWATLHPKRPGRETQHGHSHSHAQQLHCHSSSSISTCLLYEKWYNQRGRGLRVGHEDWFISKWEVRWERNRKIQNDRKIKARVGEWCLNHWHGTAIEVWDLSMEVHLWTLLDINNVNNLCEQ